jgi:hypothetical protein
MKHVGLVLAALIVGAACSPAKSSTAPPTSTVAVATDATTTAPPPTTTTVAVDPNVPPAVIDLPYLTAVMAKLRMLDLQRVALLQRDHQVNPEIIALLHAEYTQPEFDNQVTSASDFLLKTSPNLRPVAERGAAITTPTRILNNSQKCVSFIATEDFSREAATPVPVGSDLIVLRPIEQAQDPQRFNQTPWQISFSIIPQDESKPSSGENLCIA